MADYDDIFDIFRSSGRKAYICSLVPELIEEKEQPEKVDGSTSDEDDEHLERRIERLDALFDKANDFFERAEDAVDRIGDGICSLLGLDEEEPDPEPERRFPMIVGGIDADLTDKYLDEFEDNIYFLSDMYKGCGGERLRQADRFRICQQAEKCCRKGMEGDGRKFAQKRMTMCHICLE